MKIKLSLALIFVVISLTAFNYFSPLQKREQLYNTQVGVNIQLAHKLIIAGSEILIADSLKLKQKRDYQLNNKTGEISFKQIFEQVEITYNFYPDDLLTEYHLYKVVDFSDTLKVKQQRRTTSLYQTNTNLNISGSKTISVSVANNQDFSIDQSLFLQLDGELGKNINIEAQLTDSQSPITPEGDSREISSLDRVFIRLYGKPYELAFGDLEMKFSETEFLNYKTSFEGLKASWLGKQKATAALAVSKGKNKTLFITPIEGKQGPYYLSNNEGGLQLIPGSENVFLDGNQLQRGADYVIDYSEGSITFSNDYILTKNSFVQVTFQYSDEEFRQNMYLVSSKVIPWDNLVITTGLISQNDDKNSPLQEDFESADLDSLKAGGDGLVYGDGVVFAPGSGDYILSESGEYYVFLGNGDGDYNIYFSLVEDGTGSYAFSGEGYSFVGSGNGNYLPLRLLPKPTSKSNLDINVKYKLNTIELETEVLASSMDENTLSAQDDDNNEGYAYFSQIIWRPDFDKINPEFNLYYKGETDNLNPFAEIINPQQSFELEAIPDSVSYNEIGGSIRLNFLKKLFPYWSLRSKTSDKFLNQKYSDFKLELKQGKYSPHLKFRWLDWEQDFDNYDVESAKGGNLEYSVLYKIWRLNFELSQINKVREKEFQYFPKVGGKSKLQNAVAEYKTEKRVAVKFQYEKEVSDSLTYNDEWQKFETSKRFKTWWKLNLDKHSLAASYSRLSVKQDSIKHFDLAELKLQNNFLSDGLSLNSSYNLRNVEFFPKIRDLIYDGFGILDSTGVPAEDEDEAGYSYEVTDIDYDNPKMAVDINANVSMYVTPSRFAKGYWKKIRSETQLMISENSIFPDKIELYLLSPEALQNKLYTNYGRYRLEQSFWLDIFPKIVTLDFTYLKEETLDNRYIDDSSRTSQLSYKTGLGYNGFKKSKIKLIYANENSSESRYEENWELQSWEVELRNRLSNSMNLKSTLGYL